MNEYKRKDGFELRNTEPGVYALVPQGAPENTVEPLLMLNGAGAYLWGFLEDAVTAEGIIINCAERFDVDRDIMEKDVCEFLDMLSDKDLLEITDVEY